MEPITTTTVSTRNRFATLQDESGDFSNRPITPDDKCKTSMNPRNHSVHCDKPLRLCRQDPTRNYYCDGEDCLSKGVCQDMQQLYSCADCDFDICKDCLKDFKCELK